MPGRRKMRPIAPRSVVTEYNAISRKDSVGFSNTQEQESGGIEKDGK
jgi:hypothetical protein